LFLLLLSRMNVILACLYRMEGCVLLSVLYVVCHAVPISSLKESFQFSTCSLAACLMRWSGGVFEKCILQFWARRAITRTPKPPTQQAPRPHQHPSTHHPSQTLRPIHRVVSSRRQTEDTRHERRETSVMLVSYHITSYPREHNII
jgi:hypothetical protein